MDRVQPKQTVLIPHKDSSKTPNPYSRQSDIHPDQGNDKPSRNKFEYNSIQQLYTAAKLASILFYLAASSNETLQILARLAFREYKNSIYPKLKYFQT
jgi:hypothetical protein